MRCVEVDGPALLDLRVGWSHIALVGTTKQLRYGLFPLIATASAAVLA